MSWTSTQRENNYILTLEDRNGKVLDSFEGFVPGGTITMARNTELRRIANISSVNDNMKAHPYAMIRMRVETNEGDSADLGTFCIQSRKSVYNDGVENTNYELGSIMYKVKTSLVNHNSHFQGNVRLWDIMKGTGVDDGIVHYDAIGGVENRYHNYGGDGIMFSAGTSALEVLSTICSDYNVVYNPQDFRINIEPYVSPKSKSATFTFAEDNRTIAGQIEVSDNTYSQINRAIVKCSNSSVNLVGFYDAKNGVGVAPAVREQYIAQSWDENEISPQTQAAVDNAAKKHLEDSVMGKRTFTFDGVFVGVREGDVVALVLNNATIKCVVESIQLTTNAAMNCQYELKEL